MLNLHGSKNTRYCVFKKSLLATVVVAALSIGAQEAEAASCSYTNFTIGFEVVAVEANANATQYRYVVSPLRCDGTGTVVYDPGTGFSDGYDLGWITPANLVSTVNSTFFFGSTNRIFVSACNTHMLVVNRYGPTGKTVDGISMAAYPTRAAPYVGVYSKPVYQKLGARFGMANDPVTSSCLLSPDSGQNAGPTCGEAGCNGTNPINPAWRGNKYQVERDYTSAPTATLDYVRYYNSRATRVAGLSPITADSTVAGVWTHNYRRAVQLFVAPDNTGINTVQSAAVLRPDGSITVFRPSGSNWVPAQPNTQDKLTRLVGNTWVFQTANNEVETYDAAGKLLSITDHKGQGKTIAYDGSGRPITVTNAFGRTLTIAYDASGRVSTVTGSDGQPIQYAYTGNNLTSVTYPGTQTRGYAYENTTYGAALTGIVDENSQRFATWQYDTQGRAYSSEHGATGSGIDKYLITYNANGSASIADPLTTTRTYTYQDVHETARVSGITQPAGSGSAAASTSRTYDANGNVASRTDFNGNKVCYGYDPARNLETKRVEGLTAAAVCTTALTTPPAPTTANPVRTISTQWHSYWRLPVKVAEPKRLTTYVYNGDTYSGNVVTCAPAGATVPSLSGGTQPIGVLCRKIEQNTTDATGSQGVGATVTGTDRISNWTYDQYGQVLTADGPRTDISDVTTYTYHSATDPVLGKRGNLATVTDALGNSTQIPDYDGNGRPLTIIDPNGVSTTLVYDIRGRLTSKTTSGEVTSYQYDAVGQLTKVTQPDSSYINYTYDAAHRLTDITDSLGNSLHYTLDVMGNRIKDETKDPLGTLARQTDRVYDALNRLQTLTGAQQ